MNLRDLMKKLDTIAEAEAAPAAENPWIPKPDTSKQDAWAKLSPAQQKWLGYADPTDSAILARMRSAVPDEPVAAPAAAAAPEPAAQPAVDAATAASAADKLARLNQLIAGLKPAGTPAAAPVGTTTKPVAKPTMDPATAEKIRQIDASLKNVNPNLEMNKAYIARLQAEKAALLKAPAKESIELGIASQLVESFGYDTTDEGIAGTVASKAAKMLPGVGLAYGAYDAYDRAKEGDYTGAAMAGASGIASLVPGIGTAVSAGLDSANLVRDYKAGKFSTPAPTATAANTTQQPAAKPSVGPVKNLGVANMQKALGVTVDGIMGPKTLAAMKAQPEVSAKFGFGQDGQPTKSVAESMASLRERLAVIEAEQIAATEGAMATGWNMAKNLVGGLKGAPVIGATKSAAEKEAEVAARLAGGMKPAQATQISDVKKAADSYGAVAANRAGKAVTNNPVKAGIAGAGVGAAGAALTGGGSAPAPAAAPAGTTVKKPVAKPTAPAVAAPDLSEINQLMADLAQYDDPATQQALAAARQALSAATGNKEIGSADQAAIQADMKDAW